MTQEMALLVLSWQVACLYHDKENDTLLPGATSATQAESDELDKIHDEKVPEVSWDEFNDVYGSFQTAAGRARACVSALEKSKPEFKQLVVDCMTRIANASEEDDNDSNISAEEQTFIDQMKKAMGL